jgi:hypothetical protein
MLSAVIMALYSAHMMGFGGVWGDGDVKLMDTSLTLVLGYWIGSSHGSISKDERGDK